MGRSSVRATKSAKRCQASLMGWCPVKIPVSMATSRATLSGCSTAMRRPIGPPQSCSTRVTSRRSRSSSSEAITSVCRSKEYHDSEIGLSERPNPTRSGATQRKPASRTGGITLRHRNDQVGFGRSDKPISESWYSFDRHTEVIASLLDDLDLRDVTLVLHDWGGPIGLRIAVEQPDRVARLVAMDTGIFTGH